MPTRRDPEWIGGSVKKCRPGTLSGSSTNKQLGAINFARLLSGLTPLALDNDTVPQAQAAALMMTAKNAVNHYPPRSWPCWSQKGYDAAGMSNLYQGERTETNADKIESYLDDWGNINYAVGHRRWFLYPYLTAIGLGRYGDRERVLPVRPALQRRGAQPGMGQLAGGGLVPEPTRSPRSVVALERGRRRRLPDATVARHVRQGAGPRHPLHPAAPAPGKPTLVWEMPDTWPTNPVGKTKVTVSNITIDGIPGRPLTTR